MVFEVGFIALLPDCPLPPLLFHAAHPKAKLFLTHGGSHGIYEGICHGVPMVMMPLFGDQPDNVDYMVARGVAVVIDVFDVTTEKVLEAINKVVNDTRYGRLLNPSCFLIVRGKKHRKDKGGGGGQINRVYKKK